MKAKEELENLNNFAGQLHDEKEFVDVKIVCNEKTFDGHKAVLSDSDLRLLYDGLLKDVENFQERLEKNITFKNWLELADVCMVYLTLYCRSENTFYIGRILKFTNFICQKFIQTHFVSVFSDGLGFICS